METNSDQRFLKEDRVVARLEQFGIRHLTRLTTSPVNDLTEGSDLLSELVQQPSGRVRLAAISLLLANPELSDQIPNALRKMQPKNRLILKLFYTAAVFLQNIHLEELKVILSNRFIWIPDLFSQELNLDPNLGADEALKQLGCRHQELTGIHANWTGTYLEAARHFLKTTEYHLEWKR